MPYIDSGDREFLDEPLDDMNFTLTDLGPGALAYAITSMVNGYVRARGKSYASYASAVGILETVKLEYYRRQVAEYEEAKRELNGDVF